ncbi:hypothetical protein [Leptothermofonsia sichuanensis]|nr:hypothetical protein [Leptothermofonsia sichuanensis]
MEARIASSVGLMRVSPSPSLQGSVVRGGELAVTLGASVGGRSSF